MSVRTERSWNDMLRHGSRVIVRSIRADDVADVAAFIERLSPQSRRLLFLGGIARLGDEQLRRLCNPESPPDVAFVAVDPAGRDEKLIGLARYAASRGASEAELSVAVAETWRHKGLGTLLLRHLIEHARAHGLRRLYSMDSASNYSMHDLARNAGFRCSADPENPRQVIYSLVLARPEPGEGERRGLQAGGKP